MPEETTTEISETTETIPVSMIGQDGNFVKDWPKMLTDDSLHEDKTLQTFKNVESLAKSYVHVRKQVPLDKIAIPNAGGRPPTAVDYNITRPDDFPEEHWNADLALAAQDLFHKIGLNQKQVAALMKFNNANVLEALKAQNDAFIANRESNKDVLFNKWGAAYDQRKHWGNVGIEKGVNGDEDLKNKFLNTPLEGGGVIGDLPETSIIFANVGEKFREHGDIVTTKVSTPADIQAKIDKIQHDPRYTSRDKSVRQPLIDEVMKLRQELIKVTPTGR